MLSNLFTPQPVLDEDTIAWLFDTYDWALKQFGADVFFNDTLMIAPNNEFFPGQGNSPEAMAELIFSQVQNYAHLQHWRCTTIDHSEFTPPDLSQLNLPGKERNTAMLSESVEQPEPLPIPFDPQMVMNPEAMISSYAHVLAQYLGSQATENPPGGSENWLMVTEILGVFLGFGLMYANSAFTAPTSCGSCSAGMATRPSFLSQYDLTYALAIFTQLKGISDKEVNKHLKKSLRKFYKSAVKDVNSRTDKIDSLMAIKKSSSIPTSKAVNNH